MGLFDFIRGEFVEVIDWVENDQDTILWKFPDADKNIKYEAQLTVRESQKAVFLDEGKLADIFDAGRHTLITQNMPLMTSLRNWDKGFKSPFLADVYFVSMKTFTNLKWGTPNPIILRDPEFKQVRVKAHGTYFVKVKDIKTFVSQYAGTNRIVKVQALENSLREIIVQYFSEALAEAKVSVLDLAANYSELGEKMKPILQQAFEPFGIELVNFQIASTTLPKEVLEFYDKMTNMNMVENMNKFQQFQQANAIEKAADNPGGGAGEGIGMGMGMGMANMMMNQQQKSNDESSTKPQTKDEIMKTLKELGELKKAGVLTAKEFDAKKKELLARL